jgi:hypothetical protein
MHRYDRIWTAWVNGHLTKDEAMDLAALYAGWARVRFLARLEAQLLA